MHSSRALSKRGPSPIVWLVGALGAALPAATVTAGEWRATSSVGVGAIVSDNVCLTVDDTQTDAVGTVTPRVAVNGEGGRLRINADVRAELNTLEINEIVCPAGIGGGGGGNQFRNRESVVPRGRAGAEFDVVGNWLYLRADATASQNAINPLAPGGEDNVNARFNTNTTYQYGVGATASRPLPSDLFIDATVDYDVQRNGFGLIGDSEQERATFRFGQDPSASRLSLGVAANYQKIHFDEEIFSVERPDGISESELNSVEVNANLVLLRSWGLNARYGVEDNQFLSAPGQEIDGEYWDVGVRWTPNTRLTFDAGYGERFYGPNPRASLSWRHKRSTLSAQWQQNVNFPRNLRGVPVVEASRSLEPLDPLPGDPLGSDGIPTFATQNAIQIESVTLRYQFTARRTGFGVFGAWSDQERFFDGATLETFTVGANTYRNLARTLSINANVRWLDNEGIGNIGVGGGARGGLRGWQAGVGLAKELGTHTTLSLRYSYRDEESVNIGEFTENRIQLNINYRFQ
jgi:uncharacterized protein (PEP-CTERM system associated)